MRSLLLLAEMMFLLPLTITEPFVGVLAFYFISFMNPQQIAWGVATYFPWALLAFCATMSGWAVSRTEPKRIPFTAMNVLIVLFMIGITVNMQYALSPSSAEFEGWSSAMKVFTFLLITSALATSRRRVDALVWVIVIAIGYWIITEGGISVVTLGHHKAWGPPHSQIHDNNTFAAAVLIIMPLINYLRLQAKDKLIRLGHGLALGVSIVTVVSSYSRGALLGLVAVAFVLWLRSRHKLVTVVVVGGALVLGISMMPDSWWERMSTIRDYQGDNSAESRLVLWQLGWRFALSRPWTGFGFHASLFQPIADLVAHGPLKRYQEIHSVWFQILGEQGFLVGAVWLLMTVAGVLSTFRIMRATHGRADLTWAYDLARMGQISILAYVVTGTFLPISTWDVYFTILVIISATHRVVAHKLALEGAASVQHRWSRSVARVAGPPRPPPLGAGNVVT